VQSGFQEPYLSLRKKGKDGSAICWRTKKGHYKKKKKLEKKDEDREITATNHQLPI